jgi:hypothetical protein
VHSEAKEELVMRRSVSIPTGAGDFALDLSPWSGTETVRAGEQVLSQKRSFRLFSDHLFRHPADPGGAEYRLRVRGVSEYALWRGSSLVALRERKGLRYLEAVGLLFCGIVVVEALLGFATGASGRDLSSVLEPLPEGLTALVLAAPLSWWMGRRLRAPAREDADGQGEPGARRGASS